MTSRRVGLAALAVGVAVALALATDWGVVARAGRAAASHPLPLAAAVGAYALAFVLRAVAWGPLLPVVVPLGRRLRAILAMLAVNHALPGPVGEVARARLVSDGRTLTFRPALCSVIAARVVDVGALAVLAMGAAAVAGDLPRWMKLAAPAAVVLPPLAWALGRRRGADLGGADAARVAGWALASWVLEGGVVWAVAGAAGVHLSAAGAVLVTCGGVLAQVAAVLPGGVGTYEVGVSSVLVALGVPAGEALAVAAGTHAVKFAFAFAAGVPALALAGAGVTWSGLGKAPAGSGVHHAVP